MKELWDGCGYSEFNMSSQHLRDQAARLEKVMGKVQETILGAAGSRENEHEETYSFNNNTQFGNNLEFREQTDLNLHTAVDTQVPVGPDSSSKELNSETREILEGATRTFDSVIPTPADFSERDVDTRINQKPTHADINNINAAVNELLKRKKEHSLDTNNPFGYLLLVNCILCSFDTFYFYTLLSIFNLFILYIYIFSDL